MKFIEMTGQTLTALVSDDEMGPEELSGAGIHRDTIVRINEQGDIEVRRDAGWDVIGGLLGDYVKRVQQATGLDFA